MAKCKSFSLQWHLTNKCDQRCKHCYVHNGKEKTEEEEFGLVQCVSILDDFILFCRRINRTPNLSLTGGDPLLYPDIWKFLKIAHEKNIPFSILGNPFHVNDEVCTKLHELGCTYYQMSLDGLEKTHDALRKPGSWKATMDALKILNRHGIRTVIMSTVSKINYREIPELIEIVVKNEVNTYAFARYCPTRSDTKQNIGPEEYRRFLDKVWKTFQRFSKSGTSFTLKDHLWTPYLWEKGLLNIKSNTDRKCIHGGCHLGTSHLTLLPEGTFFACRRFESPLGNARDDSFFNAFFGKKMSRYRNMTEIEGCNKCKLLQHCRGCRAVTYGTTGNYFAKDPQCWIKT
ncbi:MAG: radical SAM/SPASM domain protein, ACGX system [Candidatus Paceibacterota bacterium]|jgi:radical SAM/SPASM domain protein of ACGX system